MSSPSHRSSGESGSADAMHFLVEMFPRVESAALRRILDEVNNHLDDAVMHCLALEETTAPAARDDDGALRDEEEDQPESMVSLMPPSQVDPDFDSTQAIQLYGAEEEGSLVGDGAEEAEEKDEMAAEAAEKSDSAQVVDVSDDDVQFVDWPGASSPAPALTPIHDAVRSFCDLLLADGSSSPASSAAAAVSLRVLHRALDNVLQHAHVDKYRVLPIAHANFRSKIGGGAAVDGRRQEALLHRAKVLLVRCGFTEVSSGPDDKDAILLLSDEDRDATRIQLAARLLQEAIQEVQTRADAPAAAASTAAASSSAAAPAMPPVVAATTAPGATTQPGGFPHAIDSTLYMPLSRLKREIRKRKEPAPAATKRVPRITRDEMAERVTARLEGRAPAVAPPASAAASSSSGAPSAAAPAPTIRAGRVMDLAHMASLRAQIATVRRAKHRHWSTATADRKRVFTVDDLAGMEEADLKARAQFAGGSASAAAPAGGAGGKKFRTLADFEVGNPADCLRMGQEMLRLTNIFRAQEGKPPLKWHQALHDIGLVHSRAMALGTVPFGHQGASKRFAAYPFRSHSAAENVAWSQHDSDVPKTHVDGWINSPGHRKNMLARHNWCAIAVFKNTDGGYYSTQLFGLG